MAVQRTPVNSVGSTNIADLLERVLDKGVVIAGDIKISLLDIELLTIQLRLVICSVDKAREMGMDWWANNPVFSPAAKEHENLVEAVQEVKALAETSSEPAVHTERMMNVLESIEQRLATLETKSKPTGFPAAIEPHREQEEPIDRVIDQPPPRDASPPPPWTKRVEPPEASA